MMRFVASAVLFSGVQADLPAAGTLKVAKKSITDAGLEELTGIKTRDYQIAYPKTGDGPFPLVVYAHGAAGGRIDMIAYEKHFSDMAAYGFVVIAPKSCFMGCTDAPKSNFNLTAPAVQVEGCLPWTDGNQWVSFVHENTRAIDYAKTASAAGDTWAAKIDWEAGVGVAGHSMGGEVVSQLASSEFASKYNVKAAVCQHCLQCIKTGAEITTPAMFMTGTLDYEVTPAQVKDAYTKDATTPKSYRNEKGRSHTEMLNLIIKYNPAVAMHTAAFFKVWLNGDTGVYHDIVYGTGADSFCGYADMKACEHTMSSITV